MTEQEFRDRLNQLPGKIPNETHRTFLAAASPGKEGIIVKKKLSIGLIFALILAMLTLTGFAASLIYNQEWWYSNRYPKHLNPQKYEAVMAHRLENPAQQQSEDELVDITIQDVSWAPEIETLTISFNARLKDPAHYEMHSQMALDTDGSYIGEGGSATTKEDGEDRAMHWLWRDELGAAMQLSYGRVPGYGPVMDMMEDSGKRLILIDYKGFSLQDSDLFLESSMDQFRTPEGDVIFVTECRLDWLNESFDQEMKDYGEKYPDMKAYADQQIAQARAARVLLSSGKVPCVLTYSVVEYTEGMDDWDLYTGGKTGQVEFVIQPESAGKAE